MFREGRAKRAQEKARRRDNEAVDKELKLALKGVQQATGKARPFVDWHKFPVPAPGMLVKGGSQDVMGDLDSMGSEIISMVTQNGRQVLLAIRTAANEDGSTTTEMARYGWWGAQHDGAIANMVTTRVNETGSLLSRHESQDPTDIRQRVIDIAGTLVLDSMVTSGLTQSQ